TSIGSKGSLRWIGCQIPLQNGFSPVSAGSNDQVSDMPLQVTTKIPFRRSPLLREVYVFFWMRFFYLRHGINFSKIQMKSGAVYEWIGLFIIEYSNGISRVVAIVVDRK